MFSRPYLDFTVSLTVALAVTSCSAEPGPDSKAMVAEATATVRGPAGEVRVHVLEVGTVAVKTCHRELCVPEDTPTADRYGQIFAATEFGPAMPIHVYVIEHPEGTFVIDSGELAAFNSDPDYYACDPDAGAIDHNLLRLTVEPEQEIGPQLQRLGIDPQSVTKVIATHLHSDHTGGFTYFTGPDVMVSAIDHGLGAMIGAVTCRIPEEVALEFAEPLMAPSEDEVGQTFGPNLSLTSGGDLRVIPVPGHTPGSLAVLLRGDAVDLLFAGDLSFDDTMVEQRALAGIDVDLAAARATYERIAAYSRARPLVYLPAHDSDAPRRLAALATSRFSAGE